MRGTIRKRGNTYTYQIYIGKIDGKEKRITKGGFKTKKEAESALNEAIVNYEKTNFVEMVNLKFEDIALDFIENYIQNNNKLNTYSKYKSQYNKYLKATLGPIKIKKITSISINTLLLNIKKQFNLKNTTMQGIYTLINSIFNRALRQRLIQFNPCAGADRPVREKVKYDILTQDECEQILDSLSNSYSDWLFRCAFIISLSTAIRRGELASLCVEDIDYNSDIVSVNKQLLYIDGHTYLEDTPKTSHSLRDIPLNDTLIHIFNDLIKSIDKQNKLLSDYYIVPKFNDKEYNFLFRHSDGSHVHPMWFYNKLQRILKRANINKKIRWHDLRHSSASYYLQNNADVVFLSKLLGHYSPSFTTDVYCHTTDEHQSIMVKNLSMKLKYD